MMLLRGRYIRRAFPLPQRVIVMYAKTLGTARLKIVKAVSIEKGLSFQF
jgi:hypothetical protein